ncbi:MAG TPA: HD domain-containing protein [Candidatus Paceibacterota bacterium]
MSQTNDEPLLNSRFASALSFANTIHSRQVRKGAGVPYISHLMSVSAAVLENVGGESEAVAALLHDSAEDCGGKAMLDMVRTLFGDDVADIVESCTDTFVEPKPAWRPRKEAYVAHLREASPSAKLVAGCDKLHNLNSTLKDLRKGQPADYWSRFTAGAAEQLWYYGACLDAFSDSPVADEFRRSYVEFKKVLQERGDVPG